MRGGYVEQRTVCDTCGQHFGGFHRGCPGRWVRQRRTVTPWETLANTIRSVPADPALVVCCGDHDERGGRPCSGCPEGRQ